MMKKIICMVLALMMVLTLLTSCGKDENATDKINEEASRLTTSLNLWVITESPLVAFASQKIEEGWNPDKLTDEQKVAIETWTVEEREALRQVHDIVQKINKITKQKFKTQLNIKYVLEEDYYTKVEKAFADHDIAIEEEKAAKKAEREALKNGETITEETQSAGETEINEYGIPELKYPEAANYQVDILFVGNSVKYRQYVDQERLIDLTDELDQNAMQISYYVNSLFMDAAMYNTRIYGVPNSHPVGEYTYLCVKTSEMEKYGYNLADFSEFSIYNNKFYEFLGNVKQDIAKPIYTDNAGGVLDLSMVHYWNYDLDSVAGDCLLSPGTFSLFGGIFNNYVVTKDEQGNVVTKLTTRGGDLRNMNLLADNTFMNQYLARKLEYEESYVTTENKEDAAVCVIKGGWELGQQYAEEGYQVLVMENPRATDEDVFNSMFAIGGNSVEPSRSLEIITYINTNEEFRNLLQHGIEDVNYTKHTTEEDENGDSLVYVTETDNNLYKMDIYKTGNAFLAYPTSAAQAYEWEYGKLQNLDAAIYPTLGLNLDLKTFKIDETAIRIIDAVSARVGAYLFSCDSAAVRKLYSDNFGGGQTKTDAQLADILLSITGNDMTYVVGGETKTFTRDELVAAITYSRSQIFDSVEGKTYSPYELYINWRSVNGFQ